MFSTIKQAVLTPTDSIENPHFSGTFAYASRPRSAFSFASLSLTEPRTGTPFPGEICCARKSRCPTLTGLGVRAKRVLGVKNINVYVEANAARKALTGYRGKPVEELETNESFYDAVITNNSFDKSLRLVVTTDLMTRDKFMAALNDRLKPELKKEGDEAAWEEFRRQFDNIKLSKGTQITFYQTAAGGLVTHVDGEMKGTLQSPALCRSMLRIYLGADPVSPSAKQDFGKNLARMLYE